MDPFTVRRLENILDGYIEAKVPGDVRSSVRLVYQREDNVLTLYEKRPLYPVREWGMTAIAQFRLEAGRWSVYTRSAGEEWRPVSSIEPHPDFEQQLELVESDREGLFWIS